MLDGLSPRERSNLRFFIGFGLFMVLVAMMLLASLVGLHPLSMLPPLLTIGGVGGLLFIFYRTRPQWGPLLQHYTSKKHVPYEHFDRVRTQNLKLTEENRQLRRQLGQLRSLTHLTQKQAEEIEDLKAVVAVQQAELDQKERSAEKQSRLYRAHIARQQEETQEILRDMQARVDTFKRMSRPSPPPKPEGYWITIPRLLPPPPPVTTGEEGVTLTERQQALLQAVSQPDFTVTAFAEAHGVSRQTVYRDRDALAELRLLTPQWEKR